MKTSKQKTPSVARSLGQRGRPRARVLVESLQVVRALRGRAQSVDELAEATGLGDRKVRRILDALQEAGWTLAIRTDISGGVGRRRRLYAITGQPEVLR